MAVAARTTGYRLTPYSGDGSISSVLSYLEQELLAISRAMATTEELELRARESAPDKPREGMMVFADGTLWNPGAGKGLYIYKSGAWTHII